MKRTKLKRKSKSETRKLQDEIWELCKKITREKYGNVCYTCSRTGLTGSNWHTGHMWPKAAIGASLKYDLRILRPQCYDCNINKGGMGADFYQKMLAEIGEEKMKELQKERQVIVKALDHYHKILEAYKKIYESIDKKAEAPYNIQ